MAQGVDEAIRRFPTVLDDLGNEQVSRMDGCNRTVILALAAGAASMCAVLLTRLRYHLVVQSWTRW